MPASWLGQKREKSYHYFSFPESFSMGHARTNKSIIVDARIMTGPISFFEEKVLKREKSFILHFLPPLFLPLRQGGPHSSTWKGGESLHAWARIWFTSSKEGLFFLTHTQTREEGKKGRKKIFTVLPIFPGSFLLNSSQNYRSFVAYKWNEKHLVFHCKNNFLAFARARAIKARLYLLLAARSHFGASIWIHGTQHHT